MRVFIPILEFGSWIMAVLYFDCQNSHQKKKSSHSKANPINSKVANQIIAGILGDVFVVAQVGDGVHFVSDAWS